MKKRFNVTGTCYPEKHYMADVSKKWNKTLDMIDYSDYFIINRPRQYGKTTALYAMADILGQKEDYLVFNLSFEGVGDLIFTDEKLFPKGFIGLLVSYAKFGAPELVTWLQEAALKVQNMQGLSEFITDFAEKTDKKLVLFIDEVDKSSNNQLFVNFLAMLRNKYLAQKVAKTFHSVVLAGLHDIKTLKLKLRPDDEKKYNSPWNIAAKFTVDMNLQPSEIKPMLDEYCKDKGVSKGIW